MIRGILLFLIWGLTACSATSSPERQPATQKSGGTSTDNPKPTLDISIMPHTVATISEAQICIEDVRFKSTSKMSAAASRKLKKAAEKVALQLRGRDIDIVREGTYLDAFSIPRGNFNVVELVLEANCSRGNSLSLKAGPNVLSSRHRLILRFDGAPATAESAGLLQLNLQAILEALSKVTTADEFDAILESVRGTFQ